MPLKKNEKLILSFEVLNSKARTHKFWTDRKIISLYRKKAAGATTKAIAKQLKAPESGVKNIIAELKRACKSKKYRDLEKYLEAGRPYALHNLEVK